MERSDRRDHYYRRAKDQGFRSRAAYKLQEIDRKFRIFSPGDMVLELGAAPGGWSQVALNGIGQEGTVIGIDLDGITPIEGATFIRADIFEETTRDRVLELLSLHDRQTVDAVLSDLSPNLTGNYSMDQARSVHLSETVLDYCDDLLRKDGVMVMKVFEGDMFQDLLSAAKDAFRKIRRFSPKASRKKSSEIYLIGFGFKGPQM